MKIQTHYTNPYRDSVHTELDLAEYQASVLFAATRDKGHIDVLTTYLGYTHHKEDLYLSRRDGSSTVVSEHEDGITLRYEFTTKESASRAYDTLHRALVGLYGYKGESK